MLAIRVDEVEAWFVYSVLDCREGYKAIGKNIDQVRLINVVMSTPRVILGEGFSS